jgi:hypothetical protein
MNASLAIQKCYETRNLPTGHYAHKAAQDKVNAIYQKSREIEKSGLRGFGRLVDMVTVL